MKKDFIFFFEGHNKQRVEIDTRLISSEYLQHFNLSTLITMWIYIVQRLAKMAETAHLVELLPFIEQAINKKYHLTGFIQVSEQWHVTGIINWDCLSDCVDEAEEID